MPDVLIREGGIPIQFAIELEKTDEEKWFFKGIASSDDIDLVGDIVTEEALKASEDDLLKNSTIFLNHNKKRPIGRTVATEFIPGQGLMVTGMISKTEPEIWRKIQEGVLNKLSIGAIVLNAERSIDQKTGQPVVKITRMLLKEHSLVSLPANPEARNVSWWVKKSLEEEDRVEAGQEFRPWPGGDELGESKNAPLGQEEKDMSFPDEDLKDIGKRITMIRDQRHWEVKQLAEKTGLSEEDVQAIESGEKKDLDEKLLQRIATELHVRFEDIARKNLGDGFWTEGSEEVKPDMAPKSDGNSKPETAPKEEDPYKIELKSIEDLEKEALAEAQKDAEKEADKRKQDARMKQIKFLLGKLKSGPNEGVSGIAKQLEALVERALGVEDPYPYPAAYPYPQKQLDEFMGKVLGEIEGLKNTLVAKPEEKPVEKKEPEAPKTPAKDEGGRDNIIVLKKSEAGDRKDIDLASTAEKKDVETILQAENPLRGLIETDHLLVHAK